MYSIGIFLKHLKKTLKGVYSFMSAKKDGDQIPVEKPLKYFVTEMI